MDTLDVLHLFDDEATCWSMVEKWRWPHGEPVCPRCKESGACTPDRLKAHRYVCDNCHYIFHPLIDSPIKSSRLSVDIWLAVIALMVVDQDNVNDDLIACYVDIAPTTVRAMRFRIEQLMYKNPEIIEGVEKACQAEWRVKHGKRLPFNQTVAAPLAEGRV